MADDTPNGQPSVDYMASLLNSELLPRDRALAGFAGVATDLGRIATALENLVALAAGQTPEIDFKLSGGSDLPERYKKKKKKKKKKKGEELAEQSTPAEDRTAVVHLTAEEAKERLSTPVPSTLPTLDASDRIAQ